ncbi:cell division ATP-binding protein FtsE [Vibrio cyclitrophicus]|uniref:Cell division ATP-binding protein FtsE n=13 Tax=Vibrio TaxID=662 RepID=A0A7Z1ME35_9VIBR|nr:MULTISPECIES: cell division ATP-binding protein FtsE [Vibrio]ANP75278.1 cell division ATP-binding protein FtsE [Vibrio crassostreae 9CS106]MBO7914197.1 cell division ATP-binding protein FtsE [Vibrio sp. G41H]MBY7663103.1 cell division ATP-binding protein FtsE [Vibrio atlanticus]MCF7488743.1 cell division ATP-binding protein FtsE [Vibrio sp. A2-1]MCF7493100.1 cell division ATP-binding protein FtsE [Vibrio sp. G-C-1]MCF7498104.1 cell division ATP-binding protein FtsE [Vibrio sp. L5-1]MCF750
MIKFQQVSKAYRGGRQALQKVDFHLKRGEMAFLGGHSGAGKSTLLKLICAIERPTDGRVWFNDHDITRIPAKDIPFLRRNIGIVFQDHRLLMDRSIFDNVALPMRIESISENEIKRRVSAALDKTGLLDKARCLPSQLSGGEQQRVGIARAVVNRPTLLLADEPTGNLDPELSNRVLRLFEEFNRAGVTIILATHDIGLVNTRPQYRHLELNQGFLSEVEDYGRE